MVKGPGYFNSQSRIGRSLMDGHRNVVWDSIKVYMVVAIFYFLLVQDFQFINFEIV